MVFDKFKFTTWQCSNDMQTGGEHVNKDRTDIAMLIAEELLESDTLDLNNFGYNVDSLLSFVQEIISWLRAWKTGQSEKSGGKWWKIQRVLDK